METELVYSVSSRGVRVDTKEMRAAILKETTVQFVKYGYAKVTTGEISAALGISKKTLYKFFPSKEELFRQTALMHLEEVRDRFHALDRDPALTFIEKVRESMRAVVEKLLEVGRFLRENNPRLPRVMKEIMRLREEIIVGFYRKLFREGKRKGFVNKGVNENVFILIVVTVVQNLFVPETLAALPFSNLTLFSTVATTLLEGVLSPSGRKGFSLPRVSKPEVRAKSATVQNMRSGK